MSERQDDAEAADHVIDAVRASQRLIAEHQEQASPLTRTIAAMTNAVGRPAMVAGFVIITAAWLTYNAAARNLHWLVIDPPPFPDLELFLGFLAVILALMILTTQQHDNVLAEKRIKMILELSMLIEQKTAKSIEMLDRLREDLPMIESTTDHDAKKFAKLHDPQEIIDTLGTSRQQVEDEN